MADIHPIRLRGPWQFHVLEIMAGDTGDVIKVGKLQMPSDWAETLGRNFRGRVRYVRNFNCPTALEPHEKVYVVFEQIDAHGEISLNGEHLGEAKLADCPIRYEITQLLIPHNELTVDVTLAELAVHEEEEHRQGRAGEAGGLCGEVRLEIVSGE